MSVASAGCAVIRRLSPERFELDRAAMAEGVENGNAVIASASFNESGYEFQTRGPNRRMPVDYDGLILVAYSPAVETVHADDL